MVEYKMSKTMFQELLKQRTESEKKENPYTFVMRIINESFGIKGKVTRVIVD